MVSIQNHVKFSYEMCDPIYVLRASDGKLIIHEKFQPLNG
jgi:hypothetical protein